MQKILFYEAAIKLPLNGAFLKIKRIGLNAQWVCRIFAYGKPSSSKDTFFKRFMTLSADFVFWKVSNIE